MQPILIVVSSAVGFAFTVWAVRSALRSIFRVQTQNLLGFVLIAAGIWLLLFRAVTVAIPILILGIVAVLQKNVAPAGGPVTQTSTVRSAHLEMSLDHETGTIDGLILTGNRQGQVLSNLALHDLLLYHDEVQTDEESVKLLETFLDSAHPDWREQKNESTIRNEDTSPFSRQLSRDEAYQLLGLEPGCSQEDIRRAYHRLIKRVHPDTGGSAVLMAQITEARDRLLGEHR